VKLKIGLLAVALAMASGVAMAAESTSVDDEFGTLNPQELTIDYWVARSKEARFDPGMCLYGYPLAKMGAHEAARRIFQRCSEHGIAGAMPWMAWTEENGYDRPSDPVKAAEWDKTLADTGSSLGQFNYGLDILRGHGVTQDRALGKSYIDRASAGDRAPGRGVGETTESSDLQQGRIGQTATAGSLTRGSSLKGATLSTVM
jgi:TPR repeat protein